MKFETTSENETIREASLQTSVDSQDNTNPQNSTNPQDSTDSQDNTDPQDNTDQYVSVFEFDSSKNNKFISALRKILFWIAINISLYNVPVILFCFTMTCAINWEVDMTGALCISTSHCSKVIYLCMPFILSVTVAITRKIISMFAVKINKYFLYGASAIVAAFTIFTFLLISSMLSQNTSRFISTVYDYTGKEEQFQKHSAVIEDESGATIHNVISISVEKLADIDCHNVDTITINNIVYKRVGQDSYSHILYIPVKDCTE